MMKDKLEKAFLEALDNYEMPYDAAAWNAVQKKLPKAKTPWYLIGGAAALLFVAALVFSIYTDTQVVLEEKSDIEHFSEVDSESMTKGNVGAENSSEVGSVKIDDVIPSSNLQQADLVDQPNQNANPQGGNLPDLVRRSGVYDEMDRLSAISSGVHENSGQVWLFEAQKASISGIQNYYCKNSQVILNAVNVPINTQLIWVLSNGAKIQGGTAEFKAIKGLEVRLYLTNLIDDKLSYAIDWNGIVVIDAEVPKVEITQSERNTKNYVELSNSNSEIEHIVWRVESKVCKEQLCGVYMTTKGEHIYATDTYDKKGCFATTTGFVDVDFDYNLYVENSFSPNGDGINDVFLPEALHLRSVNFKMTIFDRSGKVLYETIDSSQSWDGTSNGQTLELGAYVWSVTLINEEGYPEQYRGIVNLVR